MALSDDPLLIPSSVRCDKGRLIGRDPSSLTAADFAAGLIRRTPMQAIRAYCLECAGSPGEVRKCVASQCPLWPLRMGTWAQRRRPELKPAAAPASPVRPAR